MFRCPPNRTNFSVEKTHADGRFEIAGVAREVVEAFSTRRSEIAAGMAERGMGAPSDNPRLAERAALMSRAAKRDIDRGELSEVWQRQAADLGFDAPALVAEAKGAEPAAAGREVRQPGADAGIARTRTAGNRPLPAPAGTGMHLLCRPRHRRSNGRWRIFPSARRCSREPTCSRPRSPGTPAR